MRGISHRGAAQACIFMLLYGIGSKLLCVGAKNNITTTLRIYHPFQKPVSGSNIYKFRWLYDTSWHFCHSFLNGMLWRKCHTDVSLNMQKFKVEPKLKCIFFGKIRKYILGVCFDLRTIFCKDCIPKIINLRSLFIIFYSLIVPVSSFSKGHESLVKIDSVHIVIWLVKYLCWALKAGHIQWTHSQLASC